MYADDYAHNADMFRETGRHADRRTVNRQTGRLDEVQVSRKVPGQVPAHKQVRDAESVETERQTGSQTERQTSRHANRQTGSLTDGECERQADKQTDRLTHGRGV